MTRNVNGQKIALHTDLGVFDSEEDYLAAMRQQARNDWDAEVQRERDSQRTKGYDEAHDDEQGIDHLLRWAQDYIRRDKQIEAAALIEAAREKLIRDGARADEAALIAESKLSELTAHSPEWWAVHDVAQNIRATSDSDAS